MSSQDSKVAQVPQDAEAPGAQSDLSDEQKLQAALARFTDILEGTLAPSGQDDESGSEKPGA